MKIAKLKMGLRGLSVSKFNTRCAAITDAVETNAATFQTPRPTIAVLRDAIQLLDVRQQAVDQKSGKTATYLRNEAKTTLHNHMRTLAIYVEGVAKGDGEIILLSGFDLMKDSESVGLLPPPGTIMPEADRLGLGVIRLFWKGVNPSKGYLASIAPLNDDGSMGEWYTTKAKRLSHLFTGLESGKLYAMRVATLSAAGQGTWSHIVTYRPQ